MSPGAGSSIGSGAAQGALSGTMVMPGIGTLIGAGIGAATGAASDNAADKQDDPNRPKRRRLAQIQEGLAALRETKLAAQMTAAQSAFDFAANLRI